MNPWNAKSPTSRLRDLLVLHTEQSNPDLIWSIAQMTWDQSEGIYGCRWDGDLNNPDDLGNPVSHGRGTWFILPKEVALKALDGITPTPADKP